MRRILLYLGVSLDGYVADRAGSVDFLDRATAEGAFQYESFVTRVDTVLMGGRTYRQVAEELSPGSWPYEGLETVVFTHRPAPAAREDVRFTGRDPAQVAEELKREAGKDIWLCGGGELIARLWRAGLVDELWLTVAPVVLGGGVPLFPAESPGRQVRLRSAERCGDTVMCRYEVCG